MLSCFQNYVTSLDLEQPHKSVNHCILHGYKLFDKAPNKMTNWQGTIREWALCSRILKFPFPNPFFLFTDLFERFHFCLQMLRFCCIFCFPFRFCAGNWRTAGEIVMNHLRMPNVWPLYFFGPNLTAVFSLPDFHTLATRICCFVLNSKFCLGKNSALTWKFPVTSIGGKFAYQVRFYRRGFKFNFV